MTIKNLIIHDDQLPADWQDFYQQQAEQSKNPLLKQFYQAGIINGDTPLSDIEFVALDFETTGLDATVDDIVSIGLIPFDLKRIYCNQARHWIVRPKQELEEQSVVIHGITHSDIFNAPDLHKVLDDLLTILANKIVVVHYRPIERQFFNSALMVRINEGILFPVVDTMQIEGNIQYEKRSLIDRLLGKKIPSVRLANSRTRYGLPAYSAHNALTDAIATAELLQAQISYHFCENTPVKELWQ
ncbi:MULTISPECIES: 3'-5' exonuclease [Pasteurellaceae]|uniref:3'-5' exonuclease n=1 Tax=Pasteurella atlantica TaxID=2827233 RepID=A0AAW8CMV3_9PAST|nr:3'-5' exonuclease [Pasteurella atlantica]MBR0573510.1 3'-5' exonuclease [Pasteurella atlantica]MDP8039511.1 3'-5' exonuclease [Pasteurella atlantica]MDP8041602.1 3'-5' exonuclease [Pasteurella atlantica]MDP8043739.1 3'-5' exonuclease [Pasteurella atlantica]MDP8045764.1 3'-5' exonuclease [Pasteurella atlantica]